MSSNTVADLTNLPQNFEISPDKTHAVFSIPLEKSNNDDREYRLIRLANELEALLIHDPNTDKSSAAMDVHVGQIHDPPNLQGLGHFCEHLLFMGTTKYPKENEYSEYLTKHNGSSNAYTNVDDTNYYFEVGHEHLEGALDRFAQFFIHPLFNADCTDRELRAVDSEYKNNLLNDGWRKYQLERSLSNPNHPFSQFGIGNLESLREIPLKEGLDVREELIKHHKKYYSSNLMKLVVLGREPLDQLARWVVEKFSEVENKSIPIPIPDGYPITEKELGNQISLKPVKDQHSLEITFPFPDQYPLYETKPASYITHLIGHEGQGSILSLLKRKGWANRLSSYSIHQSVGFEVFKISIELTEDGLARYEEILEICFQYIDMLKQLDPEEQGRVFKEVQSVEVIDFRFQEKSWPSYYTSELSTYMQRPYPREWILSSPHLSRRYDSKSITEGLSYLSWDKCVLSLSSKLLNGLDKKEQWFGTEYKFEPISEGLLKSMQNPALYPDLKIPPENEFIPSNFEVNKLESVKPLEHPFLIKDTKICRLWHKKDDRFWVPKVEAHFLLKTPVAHVTPLHSVKTRLYVDLVNDALTEFSYGASIAGLVYYFYDQDSGIGVSVVGYNDKATHLLEKILEKMKDFTVDPERFAKIKEELKRVYQNRLLDPPARLSRYYTSYIIRQNMWTFQEKLSMLEQVKYEDVQEFYPRLYEQMFFEGLVHGNMNRSEAFNMMDTIERVLGSKELLPSQLIGDRSILLPAGKKYVYFQEVYDKKEINCAIDYSIQIVNEKLDSKLRAKLDLVEQIADEPCFDQLRTKEQLGYSVYCMTKEAPGILEFRIIVQSEKDAVYLENRIEAFLFKLQEIIENLSDEEYKKHVNSLIEKKLEKDKNLGEESRRYWEIICSGRYEFNKIEFDTKILRELTKSELLEFYKTYIHPKSPSQKKISTHMKSKNLDIIKMFNRIDTKKLHEFVSSQGFSAITIEELQKAMDALKVQAAGLDQGEVEVIVKNFFLVKIGSDDASVLEALDKIARNLVGLIYGNKDGTGGNFEKEPDDDNQQKERKDDYRLSDDNEIIEDIVLFKSRMELSSAPYPLFPLTSFYEK
ncbi:10344_t:CDS:10 [Acaulospora morrowiae]|uniref:10344_t:CDS:1 n=1 Tax=Acaulospora morrowiae TaxID=94023 RepID=A0A9N8V8K3_9GLOM|nr:10344_t:CDS:10 [Acaulospora morrowiae]